MEYIKETMGESYLDFPRFNLKKAYLQSDKTTPILLILSSGADPATNLK